MATGHKRDNNGNIVNHQTSSTESYPSHTANSSKPTRRFECTFEGCGKSYTRAEHLGRHQLNHNPKDIYKCDFPGCKREFVRQDLCARHRERHDAPSGKATEPNTSDDDDGETSTRRVGRPRLSSLTRNGSIVRMGDAHASTTSNSETQVSDGYGELQCSKSLGTELTQSRYTSARCDSIRAPACRKAAYITDEQSSTERLPYKHVKQPAFFYVECSAFPYAKQNTTFERHERVHFTST